ncbi:MAG: glycosyltransferase family 4 protein [Chitinophagales bacterium]|nr:glycosyltransferase family 4 protein [Chitinophagales bacterium]
MKIGIWIPKYYDTSVKIYTENIIPHLNALGVEFVEVRNNENIPDVDLIWDPNCTGAKYPNRKIFSSTIPWIVTLHGASNFSLPLSYNYSTWKEKIIGLYKNLKRKIAWSIYKNKVTQIITVSKYAKEEIVAHLDINPNKIVVIYHGYDDEYFLPRSGEKLYLLHISMYQKKKNVDRIISAYQKINSPRLPLKIICPNYPTTINDINIELQTEKIDTKAVANLMKASYGFVFPSIHESFGMPLIEAMASGTAVITSNNTACREIIDDAGILINPFDENELQLAMEQLLNDEVLRNNLVEKGLERAKDFSWEKSARLHYEIFKRTIS